MISLRNFNRGNIMVWLFPLINGIKRWFPTLFTWHSEACPVDTLRRYLLRVGLLEKQDSRSYIFRNLSPKNTSRLVQDDKPLLYGRAREELLFYAKKFNLSKNFGWHSFRRGGATAAANNGVPDRLLKKHGRWASDGAKNRYVDEDLTSNLFVSSKLGL